MQGNFISQYLHPKKIFFVRDGVDEVLLLFFYVFSLLISRKTLFCFRETLLMLGAVSMRQIMLPTSI